MSLACLALQLAGGHIYVFGTYSDELKYMLFSSQNDTSAQTKIQSMALAANIGTYVPFSGFFYDSPLGGATSCICVGAALTFTGYFFLNKAATGWDTPFPALLLLCWMWGNGSSYYNTVAVSTSIKNFPHHRGMITGLMASFFGLSASVLLQFYFVFFKPTPLEASDGVVLAPEDHVVHETDGVPDFLLFLGIASACVGLVAVVFVSPAVPVQVSGAVSRRLRAAYVIILSTAAVLLAAAIYTAAEDEGQGGGTPVEIAVLCVMMFLLGTLGLLPFRADPQVAVTEEAATTSCSKTCLRPSEVFRRVEFWCLFGALLPTMGGGLMVLNNVAQMARARGYGNISAVLVQLMSVCNCCARLAIGAASDGLGKRVSRTVFFCGVLFLTVCAQLVLLIPVDFAMILGSCVAAFAYGSAWAIFPPLISELFGLQYLATLYSVTVVSACLGSLIFSTLIASAVYEEHQDPSGDCYGDVCYRLTHTIVAISASVGLVFACVLWHRTRDHGMQLLPMDDEERREGRAASESDTLLDETLATVKVSEGTARNVLLAT